MNCIYSPTENTRVVDDEEYERLLKTGKWFKYPHEAKQVKELQNELLEKQRLHSKRRQRGANIKQPSTNG